MFFEFSEFWREWGGEGLEVCTLNNVFISRGADASFVTGDRGSVDVRDTTVDSQKSTPASDILTAR